MNKATTIGILQSQSPIGRKVSLLLAYVNQHGPQAESVLNDLAKSSKPLRLATEHAYLILTPDGKHSMGYEGTLVVSWLLGKTTAPISWDNMEASAKEKKLTRHGR